MATTEPHGTLHPVNWLAAELGVERGMLARLLGAGQFTLRHAYEALTQKHENKKNMVRRQAAEADTAEIDAALRKETLMLKETHLGVVREYGTQSRSNIMGSGMHEGCKKKALAALAEIKIEKANGDL